jgi:hypothetical protein
MIQNPVTHVDLNRTETHHTDQTAAGFLARSLTHGNLVFAWIGCVCTHGATILSFHLILLERITRKAKETHLEVIKARHRQQTNSLVNGRMRFTTASASLLRETQQHRRVYYAKPRNIRELAGAESAKQCLRAVRIREVRHPSRVFRASPRLFIVSALGSRLSACKADVMMCLPMHPPSIHHPFCSYTFTMNIQVLFHERHHT